MISVLYVDDEPGLLDITKLFLEKDGEFRVGTAISAAEALASPDLSGYDAIVSDYQMPGMDGIAFLKAVRERFGDIPFILFTGRGREEVVIDAINNGADFYLQKGGDPAAQFAELKHKVRQAVTRRQAELLRIESEKRLADIINFLPDATFAIDGGGHVIAWNRAIEEMTGIPATEMLGKGEHEYAIPFYGKRRKILIDLIFEPNDIIAKDYAHIIHDKDILIADTQLPRPKGKMVTLMGKASPLYDRAGNITGAIESIRDVTDRKIAEEALLRAKKDWETIFRAIGHPAFVLDTHHRILDANDATVRATGLSLEELRGKFCYTIFHKPGTSGPPASCPCKKLMTTGQTETEETEVEALHGYYAVTCTPVFDARGRLEKVIHIAMDITARKQAESELRAAYEQIAASEEELRGQYEELAESGQRIRESEVRFRELAELLPQMVFEMDMDLRITFANQHALTTMGLSQDDLDRGVNALSFIDPKEHGRARAALEKLVRGEPDEDYEFTAIRTDGGRFPALIYTALIHRRELIAGFRGVLVDISARKKDEEALRTAYERIAASEEELREKYDQLAATQQDLQENEQKYRALVETTGTGFVIIDSRGCVLDANPEYVRLTGSSDLSAIKGRNVIEWTAEYERERNAQAVQQCIRDGFIRNFEIDYAGTDGKITPIEINATVIRSGISVQILTLCRDISDRRKTLNELRESEERYRLIVETADEGIWSVDAAFMTKFTNRKMQELFGYTAEEMLGRPIWDFIPQDDVASMKLELANRPRGILGRYERRWVRKDGTIIWCLTSGTPLFSAEGEFVGSFGMFTDTTGRKEMEEALQESEAKYRTVVEQSNDAIFIAQDGLLVFNNPAFARLTGYAHAELTGKSIADLIAPEDRDLVLARHKGRMRRESISDLPEVYEFSVLHHDGTTRIRVIMNVSPATFRGRPATIGTLHNVTEERRQEEALRESEENYRTLLENVQDVIYRSDCDGNLIMVSPSFLTLLGYDSLDECIGKNIAGEFWMDPSRREEFLDELREKGSIAGYEVVLKKRDGSPVIVSASSHFYYAKDGSVAGIEGIFHDITAVRTAEHEIALLAGLNDISPASVMVHTPEGKVLYANQRTFDLHGWTKEEFMALNLHQIDVPEYERLIEPRIGELRKTGEASFDVEHFRKDGSRFPLHVKAKVIRWNDQDVVLSVSTDISEQKSAEAALRESEAKLQSILHGSPVLQFVIDNNHRVISWNKAIEEYSGIKAADILGTSRQWRAFYPQERPVLADLLVDDDPDGLAKWYGEKLQKSRYVEGAYEAVDFFPCMGTAGTWLSFTAAPIQDADGSIIGAVETLEDVTERHNMETALREVNRKLTLLSSITRHDVTNQLMVLQGFARIAAMKESDPVIADLLAKIDASAETISRQIEFTRTYQDLGIHTPDWFLLDTIIETTKHGEVNYSATCRNAEIFADPLIDRVFYNLFDNAIRHGERVTEIAVRCDRAPDGLVITIEDDGVGIPMAEKEKIFERGSGKHTGFGLFLAREILAITNISIRETGYQGIGARFEITVPTGKYRFRPANAHTDTP